MANEIETPRFFLDRCLGSVVVPDGLREAGWDVSTMDDVYGVEASQDIADVDWIREATERGEVLVTKDVRIARNPVEAQIVYMCAAKVVTITNSQITSSGILDRLLRHEETVFRWSARTPAPFVLGISELRARRLTLRYPVPRSGRRLVGQTVIDG
ncbi:MAG: hypothetical protein FWH11_05660 [Micrococcales bacterium]|nr:hypothetical protein [Micrococcales bacterium]